MESEPFPVRRNTGSSSGTWRRVRRFGRWKRTPLSLRSPSRGMAAALPPPVMGARSPWATRSDDCEVRRRAQWIVSAVEGRLYPELRLTGHTSHVWCISISADGKRVLTSSADKTLRLWDADTGKCLRVLQGHTARVVGAA